MRGLNADPLIRDEDATVSLYGRDERCGQPVLIRDQNGGAPGLDLCRRQRSVIVVEHPVE